MFSSSFLPYRSQYRSEDDPKDLMSRRGFKRWFFIMPLHIMVVLSAILSIVVASMFSSGYKRIIFVMRRLILRQVEANEHLVPTFTNMMDVVGLDYLDVFIHETFSNPENTENYPTSRYMFTIDSCNTVSVICWLLVTPVVLMRFFKKPENA